MLSPTDAAYIAGIVDGEGSIVLCRRRSTVTLMVLVTNTDFALLRWLQTMIGVGFVWEAKPRKGWARKPIGYYRCQGDGAFSLLMQLSPYLRIKTRQRDLGLSVQSRLREPALKADRAWQEEARLNMKRLNGRGA